MSLRLRRGRGILPILVILGVLGYWWIHSRPVKVLAVAYVSDRNLTIWNALAQVQHPVAVLQYGERVEILAENGEAARLRTAGGVEGWLPNSGSLMDPALWKKSTDLLARARTLPVQARGQTKTITNVRIEPGLTGSRIFQFGRGTPIVVLERAAVALHASLAPASDRNPDEAGSGNKAPMPRREDWFLVLSSANNANQTGPLQPNAATTPNPASGNPVIGGDSLEFGETRGKRARPIAVAGWVLGRFVELEPPAPVNDYAASNGMRVVAWFPLNHVPDGSGGEVPQYLVAGIKGDEGQVCDFTMLRVYTWSTVRQRYETAYIENDLCGRLPIRVSQSPMGPEFQFEEAGPDTGSKRYVLRGTMVRRIRHSK